ncbi:RGCVC family protein [Kutzneria sp. NPDC051319]|uniref:RGCVC family protein n=1 Tax=Kutzneria sp. NPDC051319 TaxID=3155047 RepID=UPI0034470EA9
MSAVRPTPSPAHPQVGRGAAEGEETDMSSGPTMTIHFRQLTQPDEARWRLIPAEAAAETVQGGCAVCPHPADAHDEIGVRFCAATAAGKFERGCVCPTP